MISLRKWHERALFWEKVINTISKDKGYPLDWVDIHKRTFQFADNTKFEFPEDYIGLAVFEKKSLFLSKGIKIFLELNNENFDFVKYWIDTESEFLDINPPQTLAIVINDSVKIRNSVKQILERWIDLREDGSSFSPH